MNRLAMAALWAVAWNSSLLAGTVSFVPHTSTTVERGDTIGFDVFVSDSDHAIFDTVFLVIGSDSDFSFAFQYDLGFCDNSTDACSEPPGPFDFYPSDIAFGANSFSTPYSAPLLTGVLLVETGNAPLGKHEIFVSSSRELQQLGARLSVLQQGFSEEGVEGSTTITVVPEPTILMLLITILAAATLQWRSSRKEACP